VIPAGQVRERILSEHAESVRVAEAAIDKAILACDAVGGEVVASVPGYLHQVVVDRLVEIYSEGGWHVAADRHRAVDQRDDDSTAFRLRAAERPPVVLPRLPRLPVAPPAWGPWGDPPPGTLPYIGDPPPDLGPTWTCKSGTTGGEAS
jgi:hypothetical protein